MKKKYLVSIIALGFFLMHSHTHAQFSRKMELDTHFGFQKTASKTIETIEGNSYEIGDIKNPMLYLDLWYNITNEISVGLNLGQSFYSPLGPNESSEDYDFYYTYFPIDNSFHSSIGMGGKYHFYITKRFKAYGKISLLYAFHFVSQKDYYYVNEGSYPFEEVIYFDQYSYNNEVYSGFGAQINVGIKTYFTKSFGMLFEAGYLNNGYYKGTTLTGGFFFDLLKD